jgi:tetratricopeptide (TPR) repeat protein
MGFPAAWLALAHVGLGELSQAAEHFRAGALSPRQPDALTGACHAMRAVVEQLRDNLDEALRASADAEAIFATDPWGIATDFDSFWLSIRGSVLASAGRHDEALALFRRIIDRVREEGCPPVVVAVVLGCMGIAVLEGTAAREVAVQLIVQGVEQPISPLDHMAYSRYMSAASEGIEPARLDELKAQGRRLTLRDGAELAFSVLA